MANLAKADDEAAYWRAKTPAERLLAVELIRRTLYGYDPTTARLQRVLETAELNPPFRLKVLTIISGVEFAECYAQRTVSQLDGLEVPFISLGDLKANRKASGRLNDLADIEHLS